MTTINPANFESIGPLADETGATQIQQPRPIGGGATADGQDETRALAGNATFLWTDNMRQQGGLFTWGDTTATGAPFHVTTVASGDPREDVADWILYLGANRGPLTFLVDHDESDVLITVYDNGGTSITSGSASVGATRTLSSIALDASAAGRDIQVVVSARQSSTNPGNIYGVTVLEDASDTSDFGSPEFLALDDAALDGDEPYDAFLLHRIVDQLLAAHEDRVQRLSSFFPVQGRPILASHKTTGYVLGISRILKGEKTYSCDLRSIVRDAGVNVGLALLPLQGSRRLTMRDPDTAIGVTAAATDSLTSVDVEDYQGQIVAWILLVKSNSSATTSTVSKSGTIFQGRSKLTGLGGLTWTSGKRWKIDFINPAAGSPTGPDDFPDTRTVAWWDSGNSEAYVWPHYANEDILSSWATGNYQVRNTVIGQIEILSWRIYCTDTVDLQDLKDLLRPGLPPAAAAIKRIYVRQREQYLRRTRTLCHRASYDPDDVDGSGNVKNLWGSMVDYDDATLHDVGCTISRGLDATLDQDGSTTHTRSVMTVALLVMAMGYSRESDLGLTFSARNDSFSGGAWNTNTDTTTITGYASIPALQSVKTSHIPARRTADANLMNVGTGIEDFQYLKGALDIDEIDPRAGQDTTVRDALTLLVYDVDDATPTPPRNVRLRLKGFGTNAAGESLTQMSIWTLACGVWISEYMG